MEGIKEIRLTRQMKEKYEKGVQYFCSRTKACRGFRSNNYLSFIGCGVLKKPTTHIINKANPFLLYAIGLNRKGTDTEEAVNLEMTIAELLLFKNAINEAIDIYEKKFGGTIPDIEEGFHKQKARIEKEIVYKKNNNS